MPDRRDQRPGLGNQRIDAVEGAVEHPAERWARLGPRKLLDADAGGVEPIERQIDAVEVLVIRLAILQVIDDLKRGA